jgi:protein translocase SecG subunit
MEPENIRKNLKKAAYLGVLWGLAFVFFALGWRALLVTYVVLAAAVMVCAILLQSGKGGGLAALGGMGGEQFLGTRAATPVAKATMALGVLFIVGSMLLARMPAKAAGRKSVIQPEEKKPAAEQPLEVPLEQPAQTPGGPPETVPETPGEGEEPKGEAAPAQTPGPAEREGGAQ